MSDSLNYFDLVVIGTGSAGYLPVHECRAADWSVPVVDELPYGGTCALRGCDPKKVLVGAAELADWGRRMHEREIIAVRARRIAPVSAPSAAASPHANQHSWASTTRR